MGSKEYQGGRWHDYTFTHHPFMEAKIETSFWYDGDTLTLRVETLCRFKEKAPEILASGCEDSLEVSTPGHQKVAQCIL